MQAADQAALGAIGGDDGDLTGRLLLIGAASVTMGTAGAWVVTWVMGWHAPAVPLLLGLPALVLALVCAAGLPLIWRASRVPPLPGIQQAGVRHARRSLLPAWAQVRTGAAGA